MSTRKTIGVIGGSGLYELAGLSNVTEVALDTPFGAPSDAYIVGELPDDGVRLIFLPRHGRGHRRGGPRAPGGQAAEHADGGAGHRPGRDEPGHR